MDDQRLGQTIRKVRHRRGWRQVDLARAAGVSTTTVSRVERGHCGTVTLIVLRRIAAALDVRLDLLARWRAGDLDRLLNARHSQLHELVARHFAAKLPQWTLVPEVSFSIYGERGVIDILGWHAASRALLVIELKTEIVDVNELIGTFDRKRRLAAQVARDRGWDSTVIGQWLIVAGDRTNRRRLEAHRTVLRAALREDGRAMRHWLRVPVGSIGALSTWSAPPAEASGKRRVRARVGGVRA